ncbi:hypothetical protein AGMMS49921_02790 [Endomicrobiia bacterium]|nr:hypothetical protein AGMMS49921_02790 [Endomicrobiia bacterium]
MSVENSKEFATVVGGGGAVYGFEKLMAVGGGKGGEGVENVMSVVGVDVGVSEARSERRR